MCLIHPGIQAEEAPIRDIAISGPKLMGEVDHVMALQGLCLSHSQSVGWSNSCMCCFHRRHCKLCEREQWIIGDSNVIYLVIWKKKLLYLKTVYDGDVNVELLIRNFMICSVITQLLKWSFKNYLAALGLRCGRQHLFTATCRLSSCRVQAQLPCSMWELSSLTRNWTCISCIERWILNHWTMITVISKIIIVITSNIGMCLVQR